MIDAKLQAIVLQNLTKKYGEKTVVDNVSLAIPKGIIFGLLGPNGAGKSSIINIISSIIKKTDGEVLILGKNLTTHTNKCKLSIGTAIQEIVLDPFFSVIEYLTFIAGYYGIYGDKAQNRIMEVCNALNLIEHLHKNTRMLSGGMKRRLIIAKAILHDPEIIILDEPTAGVDIELRSTLWDYMQKLNKQGKTIILTTHYLEEAEHFCDRIAFINQGKIILNDTKKNILKQINTKKVSIFLDKTPNIEEFNIPNLIANCNQNSLELTYNPANFEISSLIEKIANFGYKIKDFYTKEPNLDDIFLSVFKK
jgi:ABC-2 type transport system ATP-binding protein